ncbi:MAG: DUF2085 domain-containing protein [Thermoplasmata archaeon]|nr:DUF2085 domain-containing protein [Thermoplasmata archaeon]
MPEEASPNRPPRAWEVLLSHHLPERFDRTLRIDLPGGGIHLCARCTGQLFGFAALIGAFVFLLWTGARPGALESLWVQVPLATAPVPAAIDWLTQSARGRNSTNSLRVLTGSLLGASFADLAALVWLHEWLFVAGAVVILLAYVVVILGYLKVTGAWRRVLVEHFPGIELPASR